MKRKCRFHIYLILLMSILFSSCSVETATTQPEPSPTLAESSTSPPTITPRQSETKTPASPTEEMGTIHGDLTILGSDAADLLNEGNIVYSYYGPDAPSGLWAIGANDPLPNLLIETSPYNSFAEMSLDGNKLAWHHIDESDELVVYDLGNNQEIRFQWQENWIPILEWTPDGQIKILTNQDNILGQGRIREYELFDPDTGASESLAEDLNLPGYWVISGHPLNGFAAVDPTNTLVIYTAKGDQGIDTVLRDINTDKELWRYQGVRFDSIYTSGKWTSNGAEVAFVLWEPDIGYIRIYSLDREGEELRVMTPQPIRIPSNYLIRYIAWSYDAKYLHFSLWRSVEDGPGYVIDAETLDIREVKLPERSFITGEWLPEANLLVYKAKSDVKDQTELWLLDVNSWSTKLVDSVAGDVKINIIGWTSIPYQ